MAILNNPEFRARAAEDARRHRDINRKLVLVFCGVAALLSMGSSALNLYLDSQIGQTGGLDGMGLRSILQTAEEVLFYINILFGPFWTAGFLFAMLGMVRGGTPRLGDLTAGFRRFGQVLGHMAFEFLVTVGLVIASFYLASLIYSATSWGMEFEAIMNEALQNPNLLTAAGAVDLSVLPLTELYWLLIPMLIITVIIFLPLYLYLAMCYRMSLYLVVDRPISGARAHFESMRLMRGHKWQMLKLDLSYWWYYALSIAVGVVAYLDEILPMLGVKLPVSDEVMFFAAMGLYCIANFALSLWKKCEVDAAHIMAFEAIAHPEKAVPDAQI